MAVSKVWCSKLTHHKIFDHLKQNLTKKHSSGFEKEVKNLIDIKDGEIFVWDAYNAALLTTNLRRLHDTQTETEKTPFQILKCSSDPAKYNITRILSNQVGTHVALIGSGGISVLELPMRRGKYGMFEDGKDVIHCRTVPLDERFFETSGAKVLHADWHPGSASSLHIIILTSDNAIRIYDFDDPMTCVWKMSLRPPDSETEFSPSRLGTTFVLGEVVVSFDFGQPVPMERSNVTKRLCTDESTRVGDDSSGRSNGQGMLWPVYLLLGNGIIYRLLTALNCLVPAKYQLVGPLRMYPAAEDNYGTDACSVIALNTNPEVLVVATAEGKLHHCILLSADDSDQTSDDELSNTDNGFLCQLLQEPALYVYETIELELSLTVLSLDTDLPSVDSFFCPIKLHKDVICPESYHCSHGAGVHSLRLPWMQKLRNYFDTDDNEDIYMAGMDEHSIVEHIICTKPLPSSPVSPILGLALVADRLLEPKLICLTSTLECLVFPLLHSYRLLPVELYLEVASSASASASPIRRVYQEPFDQRIRKILSRPVSNPVLRTNFSLDLTSQECFQVLGRTTQIFREQYILKQDQARDEIKRRVRLLADAKEHQMSELKSLQENRTALEEREQELTEKCHQASEQQESIFNRLGHLLGQFESFVPVLSDAEVRWKDELTDINDNLETLKAKLKKVKDKAEYQKRVFTGEEDFPNGSHSLHRGSLLSGRSSAASPSRYPSSRGTPGQLGSAESQRLKNLMAQEGDAIAKLMSQVRTIDVSLA